MFLKEIIVTPTRSYVNLNKYAGSVSKIDEVGLKRYNNVVDSIKLIPGVDAMYDWGRDSGSNYKIRGFGYGADNRVIIIQDGVARNPSLFSNHVSGFRTDSDILKRVEVVKGASSILHGSGAIGGIVAMQTKDARDYLKPDEYYGAMLGGRIESNNMHSTRAAAYAKGENIPFDILVYGKIANNDDIDLAKGGTLEKAYIDEEIKTFLVKGGIDFGDSRRIQASFYNYKNSLNTVTNSVLHNPFDGDLFIDGDLEQRDFAIDYFYKPQNDLIDLSLKLYHSDSSYYREYDWVRNTGVISHTEYENEDERWGIQIKNISKFETGIIKHNLVMGLDYVDRKEDTNGWIEDGVRLDRFSWMPADYKDLGLYIHNIMSLGKFELTLGGRFDKFDRDTNKGTSYDESRFSPRIAASYELFNGFNLLAGYAESFRVPTPHEVGMAGDINPMFWFLPNTDLKPETAKEYEVGASYEKWFDNNQYLNIKGMYFRGKVEDMISLKPITDVGQPPQGSFFKPYYYGRYENIQKVKRDGFEISANYFNDYFGINASYEHINLKDDTTKERVANFADRIVVGVEGYFPNNITLGLDVMHYLKPDLDEKNKMQMQWTGRGWQQVEYCYPDETFTIVNFKGNIEFENFLSGASLNFGVNNIFDKKYINANLSSPNGKFSAVGKGRNAYLDLEVRF